MNQEGRAIIDTDYKHPEGTLPQSRVFSWITITPGGAKGGHLWGIMHFSVAICGDVGHNAL